MSVMAPPAPPLPPPPRPPAPPRLSAKRALLVAGIAFLAVIVVGAILAKTQAPPDPTGCVDPCGGPPPTGRALLVGQEWTSKDLGYRLVYRSNWGVDSQSDHDLRVHTGYKDGPAVQLWVHGVATSEAAPEVALLDAISTWQEDVPALAFDCVVLPSVGDGCPHPEHELLGANVGYRNGVGGMWSGTSSSSGTQLSVMGMAATDGQVTIVVTVITDAPFGGWNSKWQGLMGTADSIVNSIEWSEPAA
jgi:hypothetical protein